MSLTLSRNGTGRGAKPFQPLAVQPGVDELNSIGGERICAADCELAVLTNCQKLPLLRGIVGAFCAFGGARIRIRIR
jgi:hypothetical protein